MKSGTFRALGKELVLKNKPLFYVPIITFGTFTFVLLFPAIDSSGLQDSVLPLIGIEGYYVTLLVLLIITAPF